MRLLRHQRGHRRLDGDRRPFAFFVFGAVVVLAVVFVAGLQTGRYVERRSTASEGQAQKRVPAPPGPSAGPSAQSEIRKDMNAFSEEASTVPPVQPQTAKDEFARTEKETTFRQTLAGKDAATVPLAPRGSASSRQAAGKKVYTVQAGAFRDRKAAEALKARLAKRGFEASVSKTAGRGPDGMKSLFRVLVGPYRDKEEAGKAMTRMRGEMKIKPVLGAGQAP